MDIGNANVEQGICEKYHTVMKFVNEYPIVEIHMKKVDKIE